MLRWVSLGLSSLWTYTRFHLDLPKSREYIGAAGIKYGTVQQTCNADQHSGTTDFAYSYDKG